MAYAAYLRIYELAVAMYMRARDRWRAFAEFEQAN
jgi:hypothetical protein